MAFSRTSLTVFISEAFGVPIEEIDDTLPLFSSQLLDSFSMVELIHFVEREANIRFGVLDLTQSNLDSVGRIMAYVARKSER